MKRLHTVLAVTLMGCGAIFTACNKEKTEEPLTPETLTGLWVSDHADRGSDGDRTWTRTVEDYQFLSDGTCRYESFQLNAGKYVKATSIRDFVGRHYTMVNDTVTVTSDDSDLLQKFVYSGGKLTSQGLALEKATSEQKTLVDQLYADWQGMNSASDEVGYIECSWDGTQVVKTPKVVAAKDLRNLTYNSDHACGYIQGLYYISGSYHTPSMLRVNDWAAIILCDGASLETNCIDINSENARFYIYAQEKGTGKLKIDRSLGKGPAIGPLYSFGGKVEIHGGSIEARGGDESAGIGGGIDALAKATDRHTTLDEITIYDGTVYARGMGGAGIGGGRRTLGSSKKVTINIYGGLVHGDGSESKGGTYHGAGIGGGDSSSFESVNIYGGTVRAFGADESAGIGAGETASNGEGIVNIYGGHVTAQGGARGAGIGGGDGRRLNQINIHGGEVYAYAGADGAGIGGGEGGESGDILITGGTVRAYGDRNSSGGSNSGYGAGIGSGQAASVNKIIIKGGDVAAYGGEDAAGIGTGEEYGSDINSGTIEIHGGKVWAEGKGYGAGIGAGEDAAFGVLGISGGRVDAHAGSDCGPWSGGIGAYHDDHEDGCHIGWAGWERIYIGKGMRLWTYSPNVGGVENVTNNLSWWDFVHQRPQVAFGECDHAGYTEDTCPFCYRSTLQLR